MRSSHGGRPSPSGKISGSHVTLRDSFNQVLEHVAENNYSRIALYLTSCASYVPEPEDSMIYNVVFQIYKKVNR